jgi:molecular chaperone GrpE
MSLEAKDEATPEPDSATAQGDNGLPVPLEEPTAVPTDSGAAALRLELVAVGAALEEARAELSRLQDRHLRLAAEYDNYRKRTERERVESHGRAQAEIVSRLLDAIDDLERVANHDENAPAAALIEGVRLVDRKLRQVLETAGLQPVQAEGTLFDPTSMEGLATVEAEHPEEDDVVSDVLQRGYLFRGQLLRPARVRVKKYEG